MCMRRKVPLSHQLLITFWTKNTISRTIIN
uniref:Uncharacterized protein n=1 Tax=Arundo donax TaxID=35708 RepID=A0A0A9ALK6_ARUDO